MDPDEIRRLNAITRKNSHRFIFNLAAMRRQGGTRADYRAEIAKTARVEAILEAVGQTARGHSLIPQHINRRRLRLDIVAAYDKYCIHALADDDRLGRERRARLEKIAVAAGRLADVIQPILPEQPSDAQRLGAEAASMARTLLSPHFPAYEGQYAERVEDPKLEDLSTSLGGLIAGLRLLTKVATRLVEAKNKDVDANADEPDELLYPPQAVMRMSRNAGEALVGHYLASVFEKWFRSFDVERGRVVEGKARGGRSSPAGLDTSLTADGPYIHFVGAVLDDLRSSDPDIPVYSADSIATIRGNVVRGVSRRGSKVTPKVSARRLIKPAGT